MRITNVMIMFGLLYLVSIFCAVQDCAHNKDIAQDCFCRYQGELHFVQCETLEQVFPASFLNEIDGGY